MNILLVTSWLRLEPRVSGFRAHSREKASTLPGMKHVCQTPNKELMAVWPCKSLWGRQGLAPQ